MKRMLGILLLLLAVLLCCACAQAGQTGAAPGNGAEETAAQSAGDAQTAEAPAEEAAGEESPEEPEASPEPAKKELPPPPDIDIDSWEYLYAGPFNGLGDYQPKPIVWSQGVYMDGRVAAPLKEFLKAARAEGYKVYIAAGYFVTEYQLHWFEKYMKQYGSAYEATKHVFAPGCSDHCTGLGFDITDEEDYSANYYEMIDPTVADTEVCKWMEEHCAEYGFIVRYPEGKEQIYTLACHPGHFRYVGKEAAAYIMENDLTLEEFIDLYKENVNYPKGDYPKAN